MEMIRVNKDETMVEYNVVKTCYFRIFYKIQK
jgi:hypothetical protein